MKSMPCSTRVRRQVGGHFFSSRMTFSGAVLMCTCVEDVSLVLISLFWGARDA